MTGMSLLRPALGQGLRLVLKDGKVFQAPLKRYMPLGAQISVRNAGHERKMIIIPSRYEWTRFKNDAHFYMLLGLVPMFALITFVNIFIGPAELADIPEGYEPKEYEYYKSPIHRWFAKYVYDEPQKEYERTLHVLHNLREERYWNMLEKKVQSLVSDRQDYRGWYWVDVDKSIVEVYKKAKESDSKLQGTS